MAGQSRRSRYPRYGVEILAAKMRETDLCEQGRRREGETERELGERFAGRHVWGSRLLD